MRPEAKNLLHARRHQGDGKRGRRIFIHMTYYAAPSFNFHERRIIILWAYGFRRVGGFGIFDHQERCSPASSICQWLGLSIRNVFFALFAIVKYTRI